MRRLLSTFMLATAAGMLIQAAGSVASAAAEPAAAARPAISPAPQRFGVRLARIPASDVRNPRGLRYIIDYLPPDTVIRRRILIQNNESRSAHFTVYPDAARISHGFFAGDAGAIRSELTSWITIERPALSVRPHASVTGLVTIRVPRRPTRGEHYGVVWVQQVARARTLSGFAIDEVARAGIRIYLAVGPGGAPPTNFAVTAITGRRSAGGQPAILVHVRDTGGRAVDLEGTARLTAGPGGTSAGPFGAQQVITLAPGQAGNMTFTPGRQTPDGLWRATVNVVSGLTRRSASATISLSGSPAGTAWTSRLPAMVGLAVLIAALAVLVLVKFRRSLRTRRLHA